MKAHANGTDALRRADHQAPHRTEGGDRRGTQRTTVQNVFILADGFVRGRLLDVTVDGLALVTPSHLRPGDQVSFQISSDCTTEVRATVRWSRPVRVRAREDGSFEQMFETGLTLCDCAPRPGDRRG